MRFNLPYHSKGAQLLSRLFCPSKKSLKVHGEIIFCLDVSSDVCGVCLWSPLGCTQYLICHRLCAFPSSFSLFQLLCQSPFWICRGRWSSSVSFKSLNPTKPGAPSLCPQTDLSLLRSWRGWQLRVSAQLTKALWLSNLEHQLYLCAQSCVYDHRLP